MPRFTVVISDKRTNVRTDNARAAIDRAVEKLYGKTCAFQVSSDQYYTDPESTTLYGVILRAAQGGGGYVVKKTSVTVDRY